jgi:hypothetical protein
MRKSVTQVQTAGEQTQQKPCRTSSDIGAELENYTVGRGPMLDRKGLGFMNEGGIETSQVVNTHPTSIFLVNFFLDCLGVQQKREYLCINE